MAFISAFADIALIALGLALMSQIVRRKFMDPKKMKKERVEMKEKQKEIKELMKNDDQKSKTEVQRLQREIMELASGSMRGSMKMMLFTLPVYFLVFIFLRMSYTGIYFFSYPFALPLFGEQAGWLDWYILSALVSAIVLGIIFKIVDKVKGGK